MKEIVVVHPSVCMELITRIQAEKLFEEGRTIHVRPTRADEDSIVLTLHVTKSELCKRFPDDKIAIYQEKYSSLYGRGVSFYVDPVRVRAQWTGTGYRLDVDESTQVFRVHGKEGSLIKFANARFLQITNSGTLTPDVRKKLKTFSI